MQDEQKFGREEVVEGIRDLIAILTCLHEDDDQALPSVKAAASSPARALGLLAGAADVLEKLGQEIGRDTVDRSLAASVADQIADSELDPKQLIEKVAQLLGTMISREPGFVELTVEVLGEDRLSRQKTVLAAAALTLDCLMDATASAGDSPLAALRRIGVHVAGLPAED